MALGRTERAVMGGVGWAPSHEDLPPFACRHPEASEWGPGDTGCS